MRRLEFFALALVFFVAACGRKEEPSSQEKPTPAAEKGTAETVKQAASAAQVTAAPKTPEPVRLPSGVEYTVLKEGQGETPRIGSTVTVHFKSWFADGRPFRDTWATGKPKTYKLDTLHLIPGWVEVLSTMKPGERRKVRIPSHRAYGAEGYRDVVPPNAELDFEIELVAVGR